MRQPLKETRLPPFAPCTDHHDAVRAIPPLSSLGIPSGMTENVLAIMTDQISQSTKMACRILNFKKVASIYM